AANGTFVQNFAGDENGVLFELPRGADYALTESFNPGPYAVSYSADCSGTLLAGQFKTCTITNDDIAPAKLLVKKHVINDSGCTLLADALALTLAADSFVQNLAGSETGTLFEVPRGASYTVTETFNPGPYTVSYSADCVGTVL